jgi:DNA polymerase-1
MKNIVVDIEADNLLLDVTKIHCIVLRDVDTDEVLKFTSEPMEESDGTIWDSVERLNNADTIIGHNIIGYDLPVLQMFLNLNLKAKFFDTLLASKLVYPQLTLMDTNVKRLPPMLRGSHSLKAWGYRLNEHKGDFGEDNQWDKLTLPMLLYCEQDTKVTAKLYQKLHNRVSPEALDVEQQFKRIITRQETYGWHFNLEAAQKLHIKLMQEADEIEEKMREIFKPLPTWYPMKRVNQFTKSGSVSKVYQAQIDRGAMENEDGDWGRYEDLVFNPGSRDHIARWLQEVNGWQPTEFTEKGNIIINEKVLNDLEFEEGKVLAHYFNIKKLLGQLAEGDNSWLKMVRDDGRIHGSVDTLGAVTRRCTHSKPNMAQVPSGKAFKGEECRALFTVPKGKKLIGCDADALELRTLSHYLASIDNGEYGKVVDEGDKDKGTDIHSMNQKAAGLPTRDAAKTFIYAFLYGAGDGKIGSIVGGDVKAGKKLKSEFFKKIPAIKKLVENVKAAYKQNGTLKSLDGNPYFIRSEHSALNTLLQGAGALVMKYYLVFLDSNLKREYTTGKQYEFVGNIHDEVQIECDEDIAEDVARIAVSTFDDVTTALRFRVPLRGSAAIGDSWKDTH